MTDRDIYLTAPQVRHRYGGRSDMWLWRLLNDPESGFPQPIRIRRARYWRLADLLAWEAAAEMEGAA